MVNDKLLTLPVNAGRAIVEAGALIACPLLGTDRFIKFCRERGLSINRDRLFRLERLGLFAPGFRVRTPKKETQPFNIPVRKGNNWFTKRWAWDTTGAIYGQLAGAYYGYEAIPEHWRQRIALASRIVELAEALRGFAQAKSESPQTSTSDKRDALEPMEMGRSEWTSAPGGKG